MLEDRTCEPAAMDRSGGGSELLDVVLSLGKQAVFADHVAEIQFMLHQAVRTRSLSLFIRRVRGFYLQVLD
jgi:hypothetical protein